MKGLQFAIICVQGAVALILLYAATLTLMSGHGDAQRHLHNSGLVSFQLAEQIAASLPFVEIGLGVWLLAGVRPVAAAVVLIGIAACFGTTAVILAQRLGWKAPCACMGFRSGSIGQSLFTSVLLGVAALFIIYGTRRLKKRYAGAGAKSRPKLAVVGK